MTLRLLHVLVLASFALAQPLYDLLRQNAEFFVAHRADRLDLILLVLWLSFGIPALVLAPIAVLGRVSRRAAEAILVVIVGILVAAIVMPVVDWWSSAGTAEVLAVSGLHGLTAAIVYARHAAARSFVTMLSPAVLVFPAFFLFDPDVRPFLAPQDPTERMAADVPGDTPIVFLVFDQLPLTSLLDAEGNLDAEAFPGFAALAADGIWFRNASSVADFTGWALPPIVTGTFPRPGTLPIAAHHPGNLFTALGSKYHMEVFEPITHLCPDSLCGSEADPRFVRQVSMLSDLSVVYARVVLPTGLTEGLPRLTENWRDFAADQNWRERWNLARRADRRDGPRAFIDAISAADPQPTLYWLHALLPHEPYVYMRGGRQFAEDETDVGIRDNRWPRDPVFATASYRRHLLQTQYVDWIVERTLERLRQQGLYERALIVVTSDHGVSFRPGLPMKGLHRATLVDTVAVPLFIKPPHQKTPQISDRNVQAVDVLPTIAELLKIDLPWKTDGTAAVRTDQPEADGKRVYVHSGREQRNLPASLRDAVLEAAARKAALFGRSGEKDFWRPVDMPYARLLDRPVAHFRVGERSPLEVRLNHSRHYANVDPSGDYVPARFTGRIGGNARARAVSLAIAVNGTIRATTRSLAGDSSQPGGWSALVDPAAFAPGPNAIDIFEVRGSEDNPVLHHVLEAGMPPDLLNLATVEATTWGVEQRGFYEPEELEGRYFRWTDGQAQIRRLLPASGPRPRYLRVQLARVVRPGTQLTLSINGCQVFSGRLPAESWDRTFDLASCPPALFDSNDARIRLESDTASQGEASRSLGVPVAIVQLATGRPQSQSTS